MFQLLFELCVVDVLVIGCWYTLWFAKQRVTTTSEQNVVQSTMITNCLSVCTCMARRVPVITAKCTYVLRTSTAVYRGTSRGARSQTHWHLTLVK